MLALLAPGQGSQKPGFLTPWLDLPGAKARLNWWSALSGVDLVTLGTTADADEIKDTAKTQPLLVAAGLLAAEHLPLHDVGLLAGHSIGEVTASALAGVFSTETAMTFAGVRGREMAAACAIEETGMAAVLGGDPDEVTAAIEAAGAYAANVNGAGQVVAAGSMDALAKLTANPPTKARIIALQVAGAFHTPYMATARTTLDELAGGITTADARRILLSNADGAAVTNGTEVVQRLVRQLTSPVRWDKCMTSLTDLGVTAIIELPPAGTLAGLAKRALKGSGIEILTVNTPDDLDKARDLIAQHGGAPSTEPAISFHVTVAPATGRFAPADVTEGAEVTKGDVLGQVNTRQAPVNVVAEHTGVLVEWLASDDDPIAAGQPLARIHPGGNL